MGAVVIAVSRKATHSFSKENQDSIRLLPGKELRAMHTWARVSNIARV